MGKSDAERNAVLVLNYLQDAHPAAGKKLLVDLLTASDKASDDKYWDEESWKAQQLAGPGAKELADPQPKKRAPAASKSDADQKATFVLNYLKEAHPHAGRRFLIDLLAKEDSNNWEQDEWKNQVLTPAVKATLEAKLAEHAGTKATPKASPSSAPKRGRPVLDSDSSDDEAPPTKKARKESPVKKPATPKVATKKPVLDSESSDEEVPVRKTTTSAQKKVAVQDSSEDESSVRKSPAKTNSGPSSGKHYPPPPANFKPRTSRVDVEAVRFHNDRLKDNTPGDEATGFLQNRKMMAVKGKDFNKHKQKNKSKLYAAGVDTTIRSFKFDEDE